MPHLRNALVLALAAGTAVSMQGQERTPFPADTIAPPHHAQRVRPTGDQAARQKVARGTKQEGISSRVAPPSAQPAGQPALTAAQLPAVAPRFQLNGDRLTVIAPNSSMADIIAGLRRTLQIPIEVEGGATGERVAAQIGPAPVRSVLLSLFDGSRYDYFILSSMNDPQMVSKVILTPKSGGGVTQVAQPAPVQAAPESEDEMDQSAEPEPEQIQQEDENPGFAPQQNTPQQEPEQQNANPNQVKTPEQLLEELKQMEKQKQQQMNNVNRPQRPDRPQ